MENILISISTGAVGGAIGSILTILLKNWLSNRSLKINTLYQRKEAAYSEYAAIHKEFIEAIKRINDKENSTKEEIELFEKTRDEILIRLDRVVGILILHAPKEITDKLYQNKYEIIVEDLKKDLEKF